MTRHLCIHGHFYQPPREDPWLGTVLPEGSAAPFDNWNQRIARESYEPLGFARRLDGQGRIVEVLNCYEWMSFNVGPTLMRYLQDARPATYARMLAGDAASARRLGHGNAMAQVCHHVILPLATPLDRGIQIAWGKADFVHRFGRQPEGMWLAETAADTQTLEALAAQGIRFTVLAPRQAAAIRPLSGSAEAWQPLTEWELDTSRPYLARLPSGRSIALYFYDGPLSQAVAFERLLADGEGFWQRITTHRGGMSYGSLRSLATDGETYGHHFTFGEMALAYVLDQARQGRDGWGVTNFAAHLATHPPQFEVRLHEPSSWSCVHGVSRWTGGCDCGIPAGGSAAWRAPLREALNMVKTAVDRHYFSAARGLLADPRSALLAYGEVYAGAVDLQEFEARHFVQGLPQPSRTAAWKLLAMQQWAVAAFASCAWFFEDIIRIEPVNAMTMALRSMELGRATGMEDLREPFRRILAKAHSAQEPGTTGATLFDREVLPRLEGPASLAVQGYLRLWAQDRLPVGPEDCSIAQWPGAAVSLCCATDHPLATVGNVDGEASAYTAAVSWAMESGSDTLALTVHRNGSAQPTDWNFKLQEAPRLGSPPANEPASGETSFQMARLPWNKQQAIAATWARRVEAHVWEQQVLAVAAGPGLFLPWQEYQSEQSSGREWARLYAPLAWRYITGQGPSHLAEADMLAWLRRHTRANPAAQRLAQRIAQRVADLLPDQPQRVTAILDKAARMGFGARLEVGLDLFAAQNLYWANRETLETLQELTRLLGFAPVLHGS